MNYSPGLNHDVGIFALLEARVPDRSTDVHCVNGTRVLLHTVGRRPGMGDIKQAIEPDSKSAIERSRGMLHRECSHDTSSTRARNIGLTVLTRSSRRSRLRVDESVSHTRSACRSRSRRRVSTVGLGLRLKGGRGSYGVHGRHGEVVSFFLLFGRDDFDGTELALNKSVRVEQCLYGLEIRELSSR